jgi:cytidine deaminase
MFYARGINYYNVDKNHKSIHAEVNAINNLPFTKKRIKVELFVFRTNKCGNTLTMSKPCGECMKYIYTNIELKGYRLYRIYYIDFDGNLHSI